MQQPILPRWVVDLAAVAQLRRPIICSVRGIAPEEQPFRRYIEPAVQRECAYNLSGLNDGSCRAVSDLAHDGGPGDAIDVAEPGAYQSCLL